jgi:hypothetical protein
MSTPTKSWSSKFSNFFRALACIPADLEKNVEEAKATVGDSVTLKNKSGYPENILREANADADTDDEDEDEEDAVDTDKLNDDDAHFLDGKGGRLEACIMVTPLILGVLYSYMMIHLTSGFH